MKQFFLFVLFVSALFACKKKEKSPHSAENTDFTSIQQYDVHAVHIGSLGDASDDYKNEEWPDWVYDLFIPLDTANILGYKKSEVTIDRLYPNPCADTQTLRYFATQPVNLKLVIIDQRKNVYLRQSYHLYSTIHDIGLKYDTLDMQAGNYYRMFYAFSAENHPFFYKVHIDILKDR